MLFFNKQQEAIINSNKLQRMTEAYKKTSIRELGGIEVVYVKSLQLGTATGLARIPQNKADDVQ